eukprot:TRINITY_DN135_c0_g1_i1.p1 TRINITY_DN135_c0_g1~~TRINITY_DN135_c0_g1_i1.p1  ORF type:complete len:180 (-),score=41.19 TRINITY_DN135_c0_g1_i1:201-740(-)
MGAKASKAKREIVIIGLDNAGKTTVLQQMKASLGLTGDKISTIPTIGCNVEIVMHNKQKMKVTDMGGKESNRSLWEHNYKAADAIVFVIDSADQDRIEEVKEEVHKILKDPELPEDVKLLFFANKQDVKGACDTSELKQKLGLNDIKDRAWRMDGTVATEATGVASGLDWLVGELKRKR